METNCIYLPYHQTGSFSKIVTDYLEGNEKLQSFYAHPPTLQGIKNAIDTRKNHSIDRKLLAAQIKLQYEGIALSVLQQDYIAQLENENTFTICTAHQPNIFTGHLYFIYKILHAVRLADFLKKELAGYNFVPVYYMGSEDADLDELGHIHINGKDYKWKTTQSGAVGRMKVDKAFLSMIEEMQGQLLVHPFGKELIDLFRKCYTEGSTIQHATFQLVNDLFKDFGLLIIIPDNVALKQQFNDVVKRELLEQFSYPLVQQACDQLNEHYKVQAGGREINLFYLYNDTRERIERSGDTYRVVNSDKTWSEQEILDEVETYPDRFSANVILRAVFQEMILPNIAFIGGGGELAYWLELKNVFEACKVPYPVLILRNSFLLMNAQQHTQATAFGFEMQDLFLPADILLNKLVIKHNGVRLSLNDEKEGVAMLYAKMATATGKIDVTLTDHVHALQTKHLHHLEELEKKMLRAEKRKYDAQRRQLSKLREQLFPGNNLQERVDNFSMYYARYGKEWLQKLFDASLALEQQFCLLVVK